MRSGAATATVTAAAAACGGGQPALAAPSGDGIVVGWGKYNKNIVIIYIKSQQVFLIENIRDRSKVIDYLNYTDRTEVKYSNVNLSIIQLYLHLVCDEACGSMISTQYSL